MNCFAILCGSAPVGFVQRKLFEQLDFLTGSGKEKLPSFWNVVDFPNGVHELVLESTLNNAFDECEADDACDLDVLDDSAYAADGVCNADVSGGQGNFSGNVNILLYICTSEPLPSQAESFFLCGNEIRIDVIEWYEAKARRFGLGLKVVFDVDTDYVAQEELGWEKVVE